PGWTRTTDLLRVREAPSPLGHGIRSTPARIRTWTTSFGGRHDSISPPGRRRQRKGRGSNPHAPGGRRLSRPTAVPVPHTLPEWSSGESNPVAVFARHRPDPSACPSGVGAG